MPSKKPAPKSRRTFADLGGAARRTNLSIAITEAERDTIDAWAADLSMTRSGLAGFLLRGAMRAREKKAAKAAPSPDARRDRKS